MANPTRLNSITYGGLTVGGADAYQQIHDVEVFDGERGRFSVSFTVVILRLDTSRAAFRAKCAALEAAYSKIDQDDFEVVFDGVDVVDVSHAANSGYNSRATWASGPDEFRSADSQSYTCTVTVELPETTTGRNGRRDSTWSVTQNPGQVRTLTVTATYTAQVGPTAASAQTTAQFTTYAESIQTTYFSGVAWEEINRTPFEVDDQNKNCTATVVYQEVIYRQSLAATNDPDFVQPQLEISTSYFSQPNLTGSNALPVTQVVVQFSTSVVKTTLVSTSLITSKVIPLLRAEAQAFTMSQGSLIPVSSTLAANPHENTIRGAVTFRSTEANLILCRLRTRQVYPTGQVLKPVLSSNPDAADLHKVPRRITRELTLQTVELDVGQDVFAPHSIMTAAQAACGDGWFLIATVDEGERTREDLVLPTGDTLDVVTRTSVHILHYAVINDDDSPDDGGTRVGNRGGSTRTGVGGPDDALGTGAFL